MKFISTKDNLLYAIQTVQKAVSPKSLLPILSGILFKAYDNTLIVRATDLELGIECFLPVKVIETGEIVLPSKYIIDIIRRLPDTVIEFESNDYLNSITIKYKNSQANIHGFAADEFPMLPPLNDGFTFLISTSIFKKMLRQTIFATGTDENRPVFTGIHFQILEQEFKMVATDTHRLAMITEHLPLIKQELPGIIVPGKTLSELLKILNSTQDEEIKITVTENQIFFLLNEINIISRLIKGQYPNYHHVIPKDIIAKIKIKLSDFIQSVERASLLSSSISQHIRIDCENSDFIVISSNNEAGHIYEEIPVFFEGEALQIYFNSKYLMDALKAVDSEEIYLELSGPINPCLLRTEDRNYLSILLPVRP
ncbi:DNA polymerase III, beta subunit [Desulfofarcimen acetoxidans DSM 771]|uniref:Beta sliding clamp n=1 Tax=Desulfofarcimen acetoxidans (strain ATCC 49208 / DSM 771 / KCTC 5769 / VKM B-1644 / 5575) TaxID=485916 RepID=C8VV98_DESAS|nr:DNA polymerase III subunit beta [Desulfofarcimen acetoxidans]ACV60967.1 DNA polymerase III, beta subunit [Desulfofarcimen acetoxidans DSM 771]